MAGAQSYRTWSPERAIWLQDDAMSLLSPSIYRKRFLPHARRIIGEFPCVRFHLHGTVSWSKEPLLSLPELDVIQCGVDAGQAAAELFPQWKTIQEHKKLVMARPYGEDLPSWLDRVLAQFPTKGLSIQVEVGSVEEGRITKQLFQQAISAGD